VIHASRDDDLPPGKRRTLPFSDAELLALPFSYVALGHYHSHSVIRDDRGLVRAAYPGSTCALAADDTGEHGAVIGTASPDGVRPDQLTFHPIDDRRIHRSAVDVSGLKDAPSVETRILAELVRSGIRREDMALVELTGVHPQGSRITFGEDLLTGACYHLRIDASGVRPEWALPDEAGEDQHTTEGRFRSRMRQMMDDAARRGDEAEVTRLQNALLYGLDALHGRAVTPRPHGAEA
jgi:hypothetical protein